MKTTASSNVEDRHGLVVRCSPESASAPLGSIVQKIEMFLSGGTGVGGTGVGGTGVSPVILTRSQPVGHAIWYSSGSIDGHVQILELEIIPAHQRQGFGSRLMRIVRDEAEKFLKRNESRLRRLTIEVPHRTQVIGRAFLTRQGFHHVETLPQVLIKQDLLIYQLSMN